MKREVKFNSFYSSKNYTKNLEKLFADYDLFRQKYFSNRCIELLNEDYPDSELLLTHSATGALEMIALALEIQPGDEVILPSYTFVSTANAFALRGAKLVFVDIEFDTLGIDPELVKTAITEKTKAIVCMHYAGHACKIDELKEIAGEKNLILIEDAAMAFGSKHNNKALGTFGDFGVVSFDVTKHLSSTQGGVLIVNQKNSINKFNNIYHLGTNRNSFEIGEVPYYEWVSLGSKYQMAETNAAILLTQLNHVQDIIRKQQLLSKEYYKQLQALRGEGVGMMKKEQIQNNYHEFYLICKSQKERVSLANFLDQNGVEAMFHYVPLHSSIFGKSHEYIEKRNYTELIASRLLRLPLHGNLDQKDISVVSSLILKFYNHG